MKSMMKKMILALSILGLVAVAAPRSASAYVSFSIGLPGFALFSGPPVFAPPVYGPVYAPPPVVYAPPVYYGRPYPAFYGRPYYGGYYRHGYPYRGYYRHGHGWR
jgi:hypothetical protein